MIDTFDITSIQQQAAAEFAAKRYGNAAQLYEQILEADPDELSHYWQLGLAYLLQGQEAEAQMIWMMPFAEAELAADAIQELGKVLHTEALRLAAAEEIESAWLIRQHLKQINPDHFTNLLCSLQLSLRNDQLVKAELLESDLIERLQAAPVGSIATDLVWQVLQQLLEKPYRDVSLIRFALACYPHLTKDKPFLQLLLERSNYFGYIVKDNSLACRYAEAVLEIAPDNTDAIGLLASFYGFDGKYEQAIELARRCYAECTTLTDQLSGSALLLGNIISAGGNWQEATELFEQQKQLFQTWLQTYEINPNAPLSFSLLTGCFFNFPYFQDQPRTQRQIQNPLSQLCQASQEAHLQQTYGADYRQQLFPLRSVVTNLPNRPLRIGYLSGHFRRHSIGWLARWLLQHYDRERFEVYAYFLSQAYASPFGQKWYVEPATRACCLQGNTLAIAQSIYDHEIDILVDLDSMSSQPACEVVMHKPAPVQVTWLGLDASGIPAIDYFIADPYVLPEDAEEYYAEKIWRLPQTYIAVDGFEIGTPTIRRDRLGIPADAVIFFSAQVALKRHPETVRLQMQILKQVPNSYFLIKGVGDQQLLRQFFEEMAEAEGVSADRLRFLPIVDSEEIHRANLGIADVVLDTFPYNGATTTLETLWMGIPLVTKVGAQFAARNSYTMMVNAGIREGIAWSDAEYVEWGVRLGTDPALRRQISWQLKRSRQSAPLWNAKQFTREMEAAYQQMWQKYVAGT